MKTFKIGKSQRLKRIIGHDACFLNYQSVIDACNGSTEQTLTHPAERVIFFKNTTDKILIACVVSMDVEIHYERFKCQSGSSFIVPSLKQITNIKPTFYVRNKNGEPEEVHALFGFGAISYDFEQYLETGCWTRKFVLDTLNLNCMISNARKNCSKKSRHPRHHTPFIERWRNSIEAKAA